uniref:Uncharacterized protein n=1 Tax=Anguilla anguilla TaxID=7936 RepID=A0A0E9XDS9_ANGAN
MAGRRVCEERVQQVHAPYCCGVIMGGAHLSTTIGAEQSDYFLFALPFILSRSQPEPRLAAV